ncbi:MAG: S9 family peptidase, partial [Mucilaginibacter polytrichastri]|nr:S9 family peptidase [Mucilaginibacter polytrichastri]
KTDQLKEFVVLRRRDSLKKVAQKEDDALKPKLSKEIVTGERALNGLQISPDGRYITYRLIQYPDGNKTAEVPNYVTQSGYTEEIPARTKVGSALPKSETFIYDRTRDSVYKISTQEIPGIKDLPDYVKDYPKQLAERQKKNEDRSVIVHGPFWNDAATMAVVVVGAQDNKDRWIMRLDASTGKLSLLDRQRDEAWIGGPGIGGAFSAGKVGWINDSRFYFQSEASGYSHIYTADVKSGSKRALTSGRWEVQTLQISNDKKSFYFTANTEHPGITHFYRISVNGGNPEKLTSMKGGNEVSLSPDEKWLAVRYSFSNKPWELYIQPNKPKAKARKVTSSASAEFNRYPWREPEMITYKNRYGKDIYARLYRPKNQDPKKPAVIFVHGAGYLQNVHFWWSQYFREYMFHNLLADNGYTVLDVDYTASSGYGRDHRTGIYRHMGGKDLDDQVDGARLLVDKYGIDPKRIGIYGGSYGGFITLMALFTQPDVFAAGAGLRSVTDWAHYNQGYTANILNTPVEDEKAYRQSSPIYFAAGLKNRLLMCHGMVDVNVNYQDIVRLSQRLIELKKENWELASYPVEDHGFVEPESWTDEYKRIFKLFEETLKK